MTCLSFLDPDDTALAVPSAMRGVRGVRGERERELALRFARGDIGLLEALYERYAGPVMTVALSYLGDWRHADEVVQDTFVKAWRAAASLDPSRDIGPWLYVIARRSATDIARRERRRPATTEMPALESFDDGNDELTLNRAWEAWEVRCALRDLRPAERELIYLTYYLGLTQPEIAKRLDLPIGTVKSRLRRTQQRLAKRLAHLRT